MIKYSIIVSLLMILSSSLLGQQEEQSMATPEDMIIQDSLQFYAWSDSLFKFFYKNPYKALCYADSIRDFSRFTEAKRMNVYYKGVLTPMAYNNYDFDTVLKIFKEGEVYFKEKKDTTSLAQLYYAMSVALYFLDKNEESLAYAEMTLSEFKPIQDSFTIGAVYHHIGNLYLKIGDAEEALKFYTQSKPYFKENRRKIAYLNNTMGSALMELNKYSEAETYFLKALELDKDETISVNIKNNLGKLYILWKKYELAETYLLSAFKYCQELDYENEALSSTSTNLSLLYFELEEYTKSIRYGKIVSEESIILRQKKTAVENMINSYTMLRQHKAANRAYQVLVELNDSLYQENLAEKLREIDNKYEVVRKEKEIQEVKLELAQRDLEQNQLFYLLFSLSAILVLSVFFYKRNKDRNKELAQLNQQISIQNNRLKKTNEQLNYFNYGLSHDTKQFVNNILNYATVIKEFGANNLQNPILKESIDNIQSNSWKIKELTDNLLILSKIRSEESDKLGKDDVDLNLVMNHVLTHLEQNLDETEIEIIIDSLPTVRANKTLIFHVFLNLINNAIRYQQVIKHPVIKVVMDKTDRVIELKVIDNGIGIAPENIEEIFLPFNKGDRNYVGSSGLGLSIVKKIIEVHQWEIKVQSEEQVGSTFSVFIPVRDVVRSS